MAGLRDLIQRFADGGQPAFSSDPTINAAWNALAGKTGDDITAQRQALAQQNAAYNENQNVQNLYGLNKSNANTFLTDASAGLTPLTTGQNPNTQTYTPDAFKTMTGFEQALRSNPTGANALMQEFQGTGSNPLLGQYNQLSGTPATATTPATQGTILPWQNGAPTNNTAGISGLAEALSATSSAAPVANSITGTPTANNITSTPSATNVQPTQEQLNAAKNLKSMYGIDNPALLTYIATTPGLSDVDLKNLSLAFNSKTPQEVNDMQTSGSQPLNYQAQLELRNQAADIQRKKDIANPNSWIYAKGNVPTYTTASQSTNKVGDIFTTKNSGILSQEKDQNGYLHITSGGNEYLINPNSNRILGVTPITHNGGLMPYGQGPNPYGGSLTLAKGGSVKMPQEYSRGNWKLI